MDNKLIDYFHFLLHNFYYLVDNEQQKYRHIDNPLSSVNNLMRDYNADYNSNKSAETATAPVVSSTTDEIVMEMVEAIIDNNNSINTYINNNPNEDSNSGNDVNLLSKSTQSSSNSSDELKVQAADGVESKGKV